MTEHRPWSELSNRDQFYFEIMITALEGGVDWALGVEDVVRRGTGAGAYYESYVLMEEDGRRHSVTPKTIRDGIKKMLSPGFRINKDLRSALFRANIEGDSGEIDSDLADYIVQVGLFGELIYG